MSAPIIKFKTSRWTFGNDALIVPVECERETDSSVFIKEDGFRGGPRRVAKVSDHTQYHDTWADARAYLVAREFAAVAAAKRRLESAQDALKRADALPEAQP